MRQNEDRGNSGLGKGFSYNSEVGRWWLQRSMDGAHRRAYKNIADFIQASYTRSPKMIVDYACGAGNLLSQLCRCFPASKLVGLDGSSLLLGLALRRFYRLPRSCARRISLIETPLPNFYLLRGQADLVVFCFPNMMHSSPEKDIQKGRHHRGENDWRISRILAGGDPYVLEQSRRISHNLRRLLVRDGICIRVEYATSQRHELSPRELLQVAFEEGSLESEVEGRMPRQWFRLLASAYFRSRVLEDVYQQTHDERDRNGGYLITVLRAI